MKTSSFLYCIFSAIFIPLVYVSCNVNRTTEDRNEQDSITQYIAPTERNIVQPSIEEQIKVLLDDEWGTWYASIIPSPISPRLYEVQFDDLTQLVLIDTISGIVSDYLNNYYLCSLFDCIDETDSTATEWKRIGKYTVANNMLEVRNMEIEQIIYYENTREYKYDTIWYKERIYHYNIASQCFKLISQDSVVILDKRE